MKFRFYRKRIENPVDRLFEEIVAPLFTDPRYKELSERKEFSGVFSIFFKELGELINLHTLFINNYVPTATKVAEDTKKQIATSRYSAFYKNPASFDGIIDEVVRVGYVKLFHRWEHFQKELVTELSKRFDPLLEFEKINFEEFVLKYFKLKVSNPYEYLFLRKINWIANCEKHFNGYPKKKHPPEIFENAPKDEKLRISPEVLGADILSMIMFDCKVVLALTFAGESRRLYTLGTFGDELTTEQKAAMVATGAVVGLHALAIIKKLQSEPNPSGGFEANPGTVNAVP